VPRRLRAWGQFGGAAFAVALGVVSAGIGTLQPAPALAQAAGRVEASSGSGTARAARAPRAKPSRAAKRESAVAPVVTPAPEPAAYSLSLAGEHVWSVRWELAAVGAAMAIVGFRDWDWGGSKFQFIDEGWFSKNTRHGGMDKIGHAFSTFVIADILTERIRANTENSTGAQFTGAVLAFGIMGLAETLDGFTGRHRFSREDIAANAVGALFSVVRNSVPGMREKLDWRLLYTPPSYERAGITPSETSIIPPYERQRYVMAVKASGFETLKETPLRYLELHVGFDARGFGKNERALRYPIERTVYLGVGLNLNEILFGNNSLPNLASHRDTLPARAVRKTLEYIQVPYTAVYGGQTFSTIRR
jgi:hypothetical protein